MDLVAALGGAVAAAVSEPPRMGTTGGVRLIYRLLDIRCPEVWGQRCIRREQHSGQHLWFSLVDLYRW